MNRVKKITKTTTSFKQFNSENIEGNFSNKNFTFLKEYPDSQISLRCKSFIECMLQLLFRLTQIY